MPDLGASESFERQSVTFPARSSGTESLLQVPPIGSAPPDADSDVLLEVRDLEVAIRGESAWLYPVRKVSFRVRRGQRIGMIGESGAGKSLMALALMRLLRPPVRISGGEVFLNGRDLLKLSELEMAEVRGAEIAIVYQNPMSVLNPIQRVGDQIVEAILAHEAVGPRAARARAINLLRQVGIPEPERRVDDYPHQFSGGMRQRVMIAIAVSANPDLLIADEPTTALDVTTQERILELLARLVEERNMALLLITHDLGVAAKLCTDMRVMYAGRIVEATHAAQLYLSPTHPYTEALLRSTVRTDVDVANSIGAIPGQPPQLWQLPSGCSFHPRCPYAVDLCRTTVPPPTYLGDPEEVVAECHFARDRFRPLLAGRAEIASMSISAYRSPSQRAAPARNGPLVEARDLVKEYGHHGRGGNASRLRAVDGVSFAISAGESFGLVGESGSGKSTLALLLLALERPTSGKAIFAGRPLQAISAKDLHQLRRKMQIVFQDPVGSLNRRKTVEEIIEAPLVVHGIGPASLRRVRVSELLELVGLHPRHAKSYPRELSGGQAQRVGIARALALKPEFVIFDEAVSSLDASIRAQILNLVRNLQTELGLTYLFISHDLAIVRYMSTRVAVMYRGRIVEVGERTQLFTDPRHPYTHELLRAIPQPHYSSPSAGRLTTKLEADGGDLPSGCRFRRRCPIGKSEEVCERLDPPLRPIGSNHWVACHFAETAPQLLSETRAASVSPGEEDTDA